MSESKLLELKTDLNFSVEKLTNITADLPEKLKELKSYDSAGEDGQNIFQIINGIKARFTQ